MTHDKINRFLTLCKKLRTTLATKYVLSIVNQVHLEVNACKVKPISQILDAIGGKALILDDLSLPRKFRLPEVTSSILYRILDKRFSLSLLKQIKSLLWPATLNYLIKEEITRRRRITY